MRQRSTSDYERYFSILDRLCQEDSRVYLYDLKKDYGLSHLDSKELLQRLQKIGAQIHLEWDEQGKEYLKTQRDWTTVELKLNLVDFLKCLGHLSRPSLNDFVHRHLENAKLPNQRQLNMGSISSLFDCLESLNFEELDVVEGKSQKLRLKDQSEAVEILEKELDREPEHRFSLLVELKDGKRCEFFPHCMANIEEHFTVVGEDTSDKTLTFFKVNELVVVEKQNDFYRPNFSMVDVNRFLEGMKMMAGNEVRLIFKILSPNFEFRPREGECFFRNPCIITNQKGEHIWAAYVEPNDKLYAWLLENESSIEIIDPDFLKEELDSFKKQHKAA
jgi:hypothetical protein